MIPETNWYPGDVKPVYDGVYKRRFKSGKTAYGKFRNGTWYNSKETAEEAAQETLCSIFQRSLPWCGLAEDPNDRRPGLDKIIVRLTKLHPLWSVEHIVAEAKVKWYRQQARKKGGVK